MNTVIVPVDFSETSFNAARYAVKLLSGVEGVEMILYHTCDKELELENAFENLERLKAELLQSDTLNISTLADEGDFVSELEKLSRHRQADLIIMGIKGRSALAQVFMGSNALKMAESKFCPVLIIPPGGIYKDLKNVLLTTDLKNVLSTTPSAPIKKILKTFKLKLHIVNVNTDHYVALTEEHEAEKQQLKEMFAEFNPDFYFLHLFDVDDAINQFVEDKNIDLTIAIHKDHGYIHKIFNASHTKNLVYQSTVPVLVIHE